MIGRFTGCLSNQSARMSKIASLRFAPSPGLFGRLMNVIDRILMAHARMAARNGDLPYLGL